MLKRISTSLVAVITMFAMVTPALALAHDGTRDSQRSNLNEYGVNVRDNKGMHMGEGRGGFMSAMFYTGIVTAKSSTGFTFTTKANQTFTVDTASAKIIRIPRTVISLADITVGDRANVVGTKSGTVITASVVFDLSQTLKPATAKGTVTAVAGSNITVQVDGATNPLAVKVDGDTQVVNASATLADVTVDSKVKLIGFWDTVLNVFNAIKIKLF
jgi:hypothetical protein